MASINSVLFKAKKLVTPGRVEASRFSRIVTEVTSMVFNAFTHAGVNVEVVVGGSFSRSTWLPKSHDADLFVRFFDEDDLEQFLRVIDSVFPKAVRIKGSRDYFRINYKGFELEFIPVLKIKSAFSAKNSMDASFFHIDFVKSKLVGNMSLEVRFLKAFCKALGVYGAESFVSGFSGYVLELLVIHFRSFRKVLEGISKLEPRVFIDIKKYYDSKSKIVMALGVKVESPLVIVDPVNPLRNASRSVSVDSFSRLVLGARLFLSKPDLSFFRIPVVTKASLLRLAKLRGHSIYFKKFNPSLRRDAFFSKLLRELKKVSKVLESLDFIVFDYGFLESGLVYFEIVNPVLPLSKRVFGPPVVIDDFNFSKFLAKKRRVIKGPYVVGDRVCFDVRREFINVKPLLMKLLVDVTVS